ncbi:MAG: glycosyltransferase [Candidatus Hodarchaeota archaeon]
MSEYLLLTKFWNEREKIPDLVKSVAQQTKKPSLWLLIDDGSTDGSGEMFERLAAEAGIATLISHMPPKMKGNLDRLGYAYNNAFTEFRDILDRMSPSYLALADVDTRFPKDYFEHMTAIMDADRRLGCINGQIGNETKRMDWPRGSGKITRWSVVQSISKFWDIDADSFLNIKALRQGFILRVIPNIKVYADPSAVFTAKGRFRFGRVSYYERKHPLLVIQMALSLVARRQFGTDYLRGYFQEWSRGKWKCSDMDVRYYYSLEYRVRSWIMRLFHIGRHVWPVII